MIYTIDKQLILEANIVPADTRIAGMRNTGKLNLNTPERAEKFARRAVNKLNNTPYNKFEKQAGAAIYAPMALGVAGHVIGSEVHGDGDLTLMDKITMSSEDQAQAIDDDEYDMTGAALGTVLGTGAQVAGMRYMGKAAGTKSIGDRLAAHGYKVTEAQKEDLRNNSAAAKFQNIKDNFIKGAFKYGTKVK